MERRFQYHRLFSLTLFLAVLGIMMNAGFSVPCHAGEQLKPVSRNVALMPFFTGKTPSDSVSVLDLKPEQLGTSEEVMLGAERIMTGIVQQALEKRLGDGVLPQEEVTQAYDQILAQEPDLTPKALVLKLADRLGVDYVVAGNVWRFSERTGSALAVGKPASMGFKLHLIHIPTRSRIWAESCDKTQQSLSQNLFKASDFIKQKGRWVKVSELAEIAVDDLVKAMPF